ncbi:MAG TPA: hypothetical protein VEY09_06055 [Pyrinomonadaceae bacterium]|nr:hypothetical protein [Pyrinomonadaceae bacterium]
MTAEGHSVGTLIARCAGGVGRVAARLRLEHLLGYAELAPRALPPRAVFVVRRQTAPRPVGLGHTRLGVEWEAEVRGRLEEQLRRAERPYRGRVNTRAEAVVFADAAEWLACFSAAAAAGDLGEAWLWRGLPDAPHVNAGKREALSPRDLAAVWRLSPLAVPAAAASLCRWGRAAEVLGRFTPAECEAVTAALASAWGLPGGAWATAVRARPVSDGAGDGADEAWTHGSPRTARRTGAESLDGDSEPGAGEAGTVASAGGAGAARANAGGAALREARGAAEDETVRPRATLTPTRSSPPGLLAEALAGGGLVPEAARLLAVSIAIFERPAQARSAGLVADVQAWLGGASGASRRVPRTASRVKPPAQAERGGGRDRRVDDRGARSESPAELEAREQPTRAESPLNRGVPGRRTGTSADDSDAAAVVEAESDGEERGAVRAQEGYAESDRGDGARHEPAALGPWLGEAEFETDLAGAFYLLNLFRLAGLPECFDEELNLSEHLSGWGLAELFARWLLAAEDEAGDGIVPEEFEGDGLWELLARLEGRAGGEPPAAEFRCGESFRMPESWAARFGADEAAHRPLAEDETRAWPAAGGDLRRWMGRVFPFLRGLLARLLGDETLSRGELARALLLRRGVVYVTGMHVDVVLGLDQISLDVRRAGLDASPGWSRDLARVVTFHFQ